MNPHQNPWQTLSGKEVYDNKWIQVSEYQVINPNGHPGIYGLVHFKNLAIGILPLDEDYNTWIVGQYRYTIQQYSWEIPEGGGALEISPLDSAKRELLEETGLVAKKWTKIQEVYLSNSVTDEKGIIYIAQGLTQEEPQPDEDEQLEIRKLPFNQLYEMAIRGEISDALAVLAILKTKLLIDEGKL